MPKKFFGKLPEFSESPKAPEAQKEAQKTALDFEIPSGKKTIAETKDLQTQDLVPKNTEKREAQAKSELLLKIEGIMSENLKDAFKSLPKENED